MIIPVLVPRLADNGVRDEIWRSLRGRWSSRGWRVVEGYDHEASGPFSCAAARNSAAACAGNWAVAVLADADSIVAPAQLEQALAIARDTDRLVVCHDRWVNVDPDEHDAFLASGVLRWRPDREIYKLTVGAILVVPRAVWDTVGGYDERFRGYGYADTAFHRACEILTGEPIRLHGSVFHLSHDQKREPLEHRLNRDPLTRANEQRWALYEQATTAAELRALLADA